MVKVARFQLHDCERCGFTYTKNTLVRQLGMLLCASCVDDRSKIKQPRPRFFSPRDNSTSVAAVNEPTIFPVSAGTGIDTITQSREYSREGGRSVYHMYVVGNGGPIDITAVPKIVDGIHGDILTLTGTSDTNTVTIEDTAETHMNGGKTMVLTDGDSITFVYQGLGTYTRGWGLFGWGNGQGYATTSNGWVETSRTKEAF